MSEGKECTKCKIWKPYSEFHKNASSKDGLQYKCKECFREYRKQNKEKIAEYKKKHYQQNKEKNAEYFKEYRAANKEKIAEYKKEYRKQNKEKLDEYKKEWARNNKEKIAEYKKEYRKQNKEKLAQQKKEYYEQNKEKITQQKKEYYEQNKEKNAEYFKEYRAANKEKIAERNKEYYQQNKERFKEYKKEYQKERRQNDPTFRLRDLVSGAVRNALRNNSGSKEGNSTWDALPYTPQQLREHLEAQFEEGMSWDNYGEWHIDHIYPQSKLPYETMDDENFRLAWDLRNLRPLWAAENISKGNEIIEGAEELLLEIKKDLDISGEG